MKELKLKRVLPWAMALLSACTVPVKKHDMGTTTGNSPDSLLVRLVPVANRARLPVEMNEPVAGGNLYVTDIAGRVWTLTKDSMSSLPFFDRYGKKYPFDFNNPVGRVYSIAFHPRFQENHEVFVSYIAAPSSRRDKGRLVVSRFRTDPASPEKIDISSEQKVLVVSEAGIAGNDAKIAFGPDGYLYISIGDDSGGDSTYVYQAQNLKSLKGKLLRIDVDKLPYSTPADNPFVGVKGVRPEIWAYGFRKFWRYSFDPVSHQLIGGDVGENVEEEIDTITRGGNYGWPVREGDSAFDRKTVVKGEVRYINPVYSYTHMKGICVVGGGYYYGKEFPELTGKYIYADFQKGLFALQKNTPGHWHCLPIKIMNPPADPFFTCACFITSSGELYVMGFVQHKKDFSGAIFRVVKA